MTYVEKAEKMKAINDNKGLELVVTDEIKVDNKELVGRKAILDCY